MDRRDYFKDYYQTHAEEKKRKRRERYAEQKLINKWGLFGILRGSQEEKRIKTFCGKHKKEYKKFVKMMGKLLIKYSIKPTEDGECAICQVERLKEQYGTKRKTIDTK